MLAIFIVKHFWAMVAINCVTSYNVITDSVFAAYINILIYTASSKI